MVIRPKLRALLLIAMTLTLSSLFALGCDDDKGSQGSTAIRPPAVYTSTTGQSASIDPSSGPPGSEIVITGSGWPARASLIIIGDVTAVATTKPYASVTTGVDGTFTTRFNFELAPDGSELKAGRFTFIARSGALDVELPFQIESRRPVITGPTGG